MTADLAQTPLWAYTLSAVGSVVVLAVLLVGAAWLVAAHRRGLERLAKDRQRRPRVAGWPPAGPPRAAAAAVPQRTESANRPDLSTAHPGYLAKGGRR